MEKINFNQTRMLAILESALPYLGFTPNAKIKVVHLDDDIEFNIMDLYYYQGEEYKKLTIVPSVQMKSFIKTLLELKGYDVKYIDIITREEHVNFQVGANIASYGNQNKFKKRKRR